MYSILCLSALLFAQTQQPPDKSPPTQNPPAQNPPGKAQNTQDPSKGQKPPGQFGSIQVPVDGTYQILAYEKFGQILPGMTTLKVAIRNNILIFPGDGKFPGKMIQLAFGPNNTIILTSLDFRVDLNTKNNSQPPVRGTNDTGNNTQGNSVAQTGNFAPTTNSEMGVYVLSTEFFAISVTGKGTGRTPPVIENNPQPPAGNSNFRPTPPGSPQPSPSGSGGISQAVLVLKRLAN